MTGTTRRSPAATAMTLVSATRVAIAFSALAAVVGCGDTSGSASAGVQAPAATFPVTAASLPAAAPRDQQTAVVLPAIIAAEDFDAGGEGVGYHDTTAANVGGLYRSAEGVDIIAGPDGGGDSFVVSTFETGEWLAYTVDVPAAANYELALYGASVFGDSAYHVEIDGFDATGRIGFPNTGSWSSFQWSVPWTIGFPAGRHVLKIVADQQYFDLDAFRVALPAAPAAPAASSQPAPPAVAAPSLPPPDVSTVAFDCSFDATLADCGFEEQAELPGRAEFTSVARDGAKAIRLHTEPGDKNVASSGEMERDDLWLSQAATDGYEGREAWWAHSILFPDDFTVPTWESYVVFDFHNSGPGAWQANFHVAFEPQADTTKPGLLSLIGYGGMSSGDGRFDAVLGEVRKNAWYDFVYHVRWSSGSDGFFDAWVNGKRVLTHRGPTLYGGQGVYLKLANYHVPVCDPSPECIGKHSASSVIHDRVIRAGTPASAASGPLEGALDLVNGVLTPVLP